MILTIHAPITLNIIFIVDVDFVDTSFNISFNSGAATFSLEVADDDLFENDESFIMYIDIPGSQNETLGCAFLVKIQDNDG